MKYNQAGEWIHKIDEEALSITYSFDDMMDESDSLTAVTITVIDQDASDLTSSMISNEVVNATYCTFTVSGGIADTTYEVRIKGSTAGSEEIFTSYLNCEVFGSTILNYKVADSGQNSYVSLAYANRYIRNKYGSTPTWDNLTTEGKKRALVEGARDLEIFNYTGNKYFDRQGLSFPRNDQTVISGNPATPITTTSFKHTSAYSTSYMSLPNNRWKDGCVHIKTGTPVRETRAINTSLASDGTITVASAFTATPTENTTVLIFAPLDKNIGYAQIEQTLHILRSIGDESFYSMKSAGVSKYSIGDVDVTFGKGTVDGISLAPDSKKLLSRWMRRNLRVGRG